MINVVLLHGWGCDSRTWQPLLDSLQSIANVTTIDLPGFGASKPLPVFALDAVLDNIAKQLPQSAVIVGWSLGGMLAVQCAARFPERVLAVVTLAANVKFVDAPDYRAAMPRAINRQFNQGFAQDPQATLRLFEGLMTQGDSDERKLLKQLRQTASSGSGKSSEINHNWLQALELLAQLDNRVAFAQLSMPGLHLLAQNDALVPVCAAQTMAALNSQQQVDVLDHSAHAIHWSKSQLVAESIHRFLNEKLGVGAVFDSLDLRLDKKKVAHSFSRAAATYDSVAHLQREIGQQLFSRLPECLPAASLMLDLGSGTGFFTRQLAEKYSESQVVGLDIAKGMLLYAAEKNDGICWLCADAEGLPLADNSIDFIFSSLAIQWCDNLPHLIAELTRVLKPGGQLHIATLGPHTLHELKASWQLVDNYVHVNRFQSQQALVAATHLSRLTLDDVRQEYRTLYYARLTDLTRELKALGAHNVNSGKPEGLTGKARALAVKNAYERLRTPNGLPATYDVIYLTAHKTHG